MGNFQKENTNLMTINNPNPFDDKLLQAVQFDVTMPPPPLNGNENGKYSKNIQFGMRRRTNIRLVDHKMDRHFGIKKQFSKFGNKEITKYPVRRGFNTQQIAKSNDNTFQINPSFGGNQRFYEDINPAPPVENVNPANNIQQNNNNGGQQLRQNHQRYSNHNPRMKPFDNRNSRPPFKYQHLQKPLPGIGKFNQRGFINRAPSVRERLVQSGNRKPIPLLKSSLKHNFQRKLSRAVIGVQNKYAKKLTKSKLNTPKTEKKKSKKTKLKPKDTCPDQETAGDDHIDINKQVFGDFKPIQVNGKKPAKGHLKPDPEEYWKQWWSLYGYVEHSIAPVDRNDPTVASVLDFLLTPNDKEFRKRKRVLLTMGVAKILKHIRINETDYALRDIFNVLKYRHQLEDSKFQQYLSAKEMQRLEMVLKNARKKTRRAFFYQSMICRWHFSTQIVQRAESGEQLKVGHARKLLANKVFLYFVCESIQELKKLIIEDWPGFEEYYNSLQST
uniref:Uncharacterized protein n=1 Tax=Musca domestica TaxID=7370 RepID=T1PJM8_MUSDO